MINIGFRKAKNYIVNNITVRPIYRKRQDIQTWRTAIIQAEGDYQQRKELLELYEDIIMDGMVDSAIEKRNNAILNRQFAFTVDGKPVDEVNELVKKSFFVDFLRYAMEAIYFGHSLIEPDWPARGSGKEGATVLIDRRHVKPRYGIVTKHAYDIEGIKYREGQFKNRVIEVGGMEDLGKLVKVAQYAIYKKGAFGDWSEYAEVFGMPFRWATYQNEQTREVLEKALEEAGSAGYVVAPEDANLEFIQANSQQSTDIFERLRNACNQEIAIILLGNTMTTLEASHSGYAQSKTQSDSQEELHDADRRRMLAILNEKLTPYLERLGYPVKNGAWSIVDEDNLPLKERLEIDLAVAEKVPVEDNYWYEKYGLPKPDNASAGKK